MKEFVHKLSSDNSEFIANAMVSKLVKDGITISSENTFTSDLIKGNHYNTDKIIFNSENNYYVVNSESIKCLRKVIANSVTNQDTKLLFDQSESLILDIDLDFFTYDETFSRNPLDIRIQISYEPFLLLFKKSNIITIALEPECCGGTAQCMNILKVLDNYLFKPRGLNIINEVTSYFLQDSIENYDTIPQISDDLKHYCI